MSAWTAANIPDQRGRVAVVTGSSSGIGKETARELARAGARVIIATPDLPAGELAVQDIRAELSRSAHGSGPGAMGSAAWSGTGSVEVQYLELTEADSIADFGRRLSSLVDRCDLLINNAGVSLSEPTTTSAGFEAHLAINYLGGFALTAHLLRLITGTPASRVVAVSSFTHRLHTLRPAQLDAPAASLSRPAPYYRSKLACVMFAYELQRRLTAYGSTTISLASHPGIVHTPMTAAISERPLWVKVRPYVAKLAQTPQMGALPILRAATDPAAMGGQFYGPGGPGGQHGHPTLQLSSKHSYDSAIAAALWAWSEKASGIAMMS